MIEKFKNLFILTNSFQDIHNKKTTTMASSSKAKKALKPGDLVHARAAVIFENPQENRNVHGDSASTIHLTGEVIQVEIRPSSSGSKLHYVLAEYSFGKGVGKKTRNLNISQINIGPAPEDSLPTNPSGYPTFDPKAGSNGMVQTILRKGEVALVRAAESKKENVVTFLAKHRGAAKHAKRLKQ